jgi:uncharacterized protein (DUF885 family)
MQNATINQLTSGGHKSSPGSIFCRPGVCKFNNLSTQNATINHSTRGVHKSIPGAHLPQAQRLKINQCNAKCNNLSLNQWWAKINPREASSPGSGSKN